MKISRDSAAVQELKRRGFRFTWSSPEDSGLINRYHGECILFDADDKAVSCWTGEVSTQPRIEDTIAQEYCADMGWTPRRLAPADEPVPLLYNRHRG